MGTTVEFHSFSSSAFVAAFCSFLLLPTLVALNGVTNAREPSQPAELQIGLNMLLLIGTDV